MRNYKILWSKSDRAILKYLQDNKLVYYKSHKAYRKHIEPRHLIKKHLPPEMLDIVGIPVKRSYRKYFMHFMKLFSLLDIGVSQETVGKVMGYKRLHILFISNGRRWIVQREIYKKYKDVYKNGRI